MGPPWAWISGFSYIIYDTILIFFVTRELRIYLRRAPTSTPQKNLSVTVLIPSRNEGVNLLACLRALSEQTRLPDQIIVIDDGSTDHSIAHFEKEWQALPLKLEILRKKHSGKARSLNLALAQVTTDLVVTIDADTFLETHAIEAMVSAFARNSNLKAAGGVLIPTVGGVKNIRARLFQTFQKFEYVRAFLSRQAWSNHDALLLVSGAFAIYHTDTLKKVGAYDPTSLVEDYELIHRIYRYCFEHEVPVEVGVIPEARAVTDCPDRFLQFLKQRQRWFGGFLQTIFRYRKMVGNSRYKTVGKFMLPIKSLDTLQPIYGLTALVTLVYFFWMRGQISPVVVYFLVTKILIDFAYHFYSLILYNRWQKRKVPRRFWIESVFVTIAEPIFFQPLRHFGALLGWFVFLRRTHAWTPKE